MVDFRGAADSRHARGQRESENNERNEPELWFSLCHFEEVMASMLRPEASRDSNGLSNSEGHAIRIIAFHFFEKVVHRSRRKSFREWEDKVVWHLDFCRVN